MKYRVQVSKLRQGTEDRYDSWEEVYDQQVDVSNNDVFPTDIALLVNTILRDQRERELLKEDKHEGDQKS